MTKIVTETFFLPDEVDREPWSVTADIYNLCHSLLNRSATEHVFIPIRSMQFMAIADGHEIIFVDSQSYAVSDNQGGRLILVGWQFPASHDRDSLSSPVPCEVVFYGRKSSDLQLRLITEFKKALELMDQRYRDSELPLQGAKILNLSEQKN